jgi:dTDP-4-amino-4,6-dideoxygalactose transaminase
MESSFTNNEWHSNESKRIHLSVADVGENEFQAVYESLSSGWVTSAGPDVEAFEKEIRSYTSRKFAVALSSGTAALHLSLKSKGVKFGDEIVIPSLTFGATAFPVFYLRARPIFLDVEPNSLSIDPQLLRKFLLTKSKTNQLPKAILPVDLYGHPCDYSALEEISREFEIPLICDAAEALGSKFQDKPVGAMGVSAILSFNGNKIITTSGGGMLLTDDEQVADKVRFWATQSREPVVWYEHKEIGYNYRLSNVLAALGRAQLKRLPELVAKRREIRAWYTELLSGVQGLSVIQDPPWGKSNAWLTVVLFDLNTHPNAPERVRQALERANIESRPIWKPLHQQPVFAQCETYLTGVADEIFSRGLCLPSGSALLRSDIERTCETLLKALT